jgi:hypothetical protein
MEQSFINAGVLYLPVVFGIQAWKPALPPRAVAAVRRVWCGWNVALALFSLAGAYYTYDGARAIAQTGESCVWLPEHRRWFAGAAGRWLYYFQVSKIVELGDTVFLALLAKPIPFLHWYHHLVTLLAGYVTMVQYKPYLIVGPFVNYCVHVVMYAYYAASAAGRRPPAICAQAITTAQTAQMVVMSAYYSWLYARRDALCDSIVLSPSILMYGIYLFLFGRYFWHRYAVRHDKKNE